MLKPRVYVYNTHDDPELVLYPVRSLLREHGYEENLIGKDHIKYWSAADTPSEERESYLCDIPMSEFVICVVGPEIVASASKSNFYSAQMIVDRALEFRVPAYIFVNVHATDPELQHFLKVLRALNHNVRIVPYDDSNSLIIAVEHLLHEVRPIHALRKQPSNNVVTHSHHFSTYYPQSIAYTKLQQILKTSNSIGFRTRFELSDILSQNGFFEGVRIYRNDPWEWFKPEGPGQLVLRAAASLFDDKGEHIPLVEHEWKQHLLELYHWSIEQKDNIKY